MKAILEFDLDDQDDRMAHLRCIKATDMAIALSDIQYNCHKYISEFDEYKDNIMKAINDRGIIIDELIN